MQLVINFYEYKDLHEFEKNNIFKRPLTLHRKRFEDIRDLCIQMKVIPPKSFELVAKESTHTNEYKSFFGKLKKDEIKRYTVIMQVTFEIESKADEFPIMCIMSAYFKGMINNM